MILLILAIVLFITGIVFIIVGHTINDFWRSDSYYGWGALLGIPSLICLIIMICILVSKPYYYKQFKIEYDNLKNIITDKDDIRDATFTMKILEANDTILRCRAFKDSVWIGIFQNKKICNMELLTKGE